ncbi:uncharacterized protein LOC143031522 isoform X1 [Oratosquilla oratoria]|uniref:uncharacterized protein LOC143031522 isoform X1 n=1 Tax=Oratosquilla oratoria TaxID=337810 RepID=UPI003F770DC7
MPCCLSSPVNINLTMAMTTLCTGCSPTFRGFSAAYSRAKVWKKPPTMFLRMFGRPKGGASGDGTYQGQECEEKPDSVTQDGFILLGNSEGSQQMGFAYDPPPNYSLPGANAFVPDSSATPDMSSAVRISSADSVRSVLDGVPFRLSSRVTTGSSTADAGDDCIAQTLARIHSFNVDQYDYNFKLEKSVLQEFNSQEEAQIE